MGDEMMQNKVLQREEPHQELTEIPWNEGAVRRYKFDSTDVAKLESGGIVWIGETAYSLEDPEEKDEN